METKNSEELLQKILQDTQAELRYVATKLENPNLVWHEYDQIKDIYNKVLEKDNIITLNNNIITENNTCINILTTELSNIKDKYSKLEIEHKKLKLDFNDFYYKYNKYIPKELGKIQYKSYNDPIYDYVHLVYCTNCNTIQKKESTYLCRECGETDFICDFNLSGKLDSNAYEWQLSNSSSNIINIILNKNKINKDIFTNNDNNQYIIHIKPIYCSEQCRNIMYLYIINDIGFNGNYIVRVSKSRYVDEKGRLIRCENKIIDKNSKTVDILDIYQHQDQDIVPNISIKESCLNDLHS